MLDGAIPVCQRAAAGLGMNDLRIKWSNQPHSVEDCFNIMFPHDYFNHVINLTNANLPVSIRNFTKHEFMQCIGVLLTTALVNPGNIKNLWNTQESRLVSPFRMKERFGLGRDRFLDWKAHLQLVVPISREDVQKDPWYLVKAVVDAFNECREINLVPGSENVIDESMGKLIPFFDNIPEGIPKLTKIIRKPEGVGVEYKVLADAFTGITLHIEIQESKEDMANKDFTDLFSKHTALVLRLTKMLHGKGHIVYGDSAFKSVETACAMLEHGTYYTGLLKTAHRGFPKRYLNTLAWTGEEHCGATKSVETTTSIGGREYKIYGHAWNEPGTADVPKKCLLSTWNHTLPVDDHQKKRWRLNPDTGLSENITRSVPRTQMIKSYFEAACAIDIHNHLRQDGLALERTVGTHEWWFRCLCTIIGFIEVDAFKAYCYFNRHATPPKHQDFIENLAIILLSNRYDGAPVEETEHVRVL